MTRRTRNIVIFTLILGLSALISVSISSPDGLPLVAGAAQNGFNVMTINAGYGFVQVANVFSGGVGIDGMHRVHVQVKNRETFGVSVFVADVDFVAGASTGTVPVIGRVHRVWVESGG